MWVALTIYMPSSVTLVALSSELMMVSSKKKMQVSRHVIFQAFNDTALEIMRQPNVIPIEVKKIM